MQVPERLALIGGSILLSSTLVFTLKSQASTIIPKVGHSISNVYDHIGDAQKASDFDDNFKQAQKDGLPTGTWGSSHYYIDKDNALHIGRGQLQGQLQNVLSDKERNQITHISIDQPVQAPQDSSLLFANAYNVGAYDGLDNIDTSQTTEAYFMFFNNHNVRDLDLSSWNTESFYDIHSMFAEDDALGNVNVANWNVKNIKWMAYTFYDTPSLTNIDLSGWHTRSDVATTDMFVNGEYNNSNLRSINIQNFNLDQKENGPNAYMFGGGKKPMSNDDAPLNSNLSSITFGNDTHLQNDQGIPEGTWSNGQQSLSPNQLNDNNNHPGTWTRK